MKNYAFPRPRLHTSPQSKTMEESKNFDQTQIPFPIVRGVIDTAQEIDHDLELAIDLVGGEGFTSRAQRAHRRRAEQGFNYNFGLAEVRAARAGKRKRVKAATHIQAIFRGYQVRRAGRQRMQIDQDGLPPNIMPPRRRRRGRRAVKRKRRASYTRKRRRSYRARRKRRKSSTRTRLRLYPTGYPKTHLIKLRMQRQIKLTNISAGWASAVFHPAQCSDPLISMQTTSGATDVIAAHKLMKFTLKNDLISPRPQPYGWDQWMLSSPYTFAVVEGSKTKLSFIQTRAAGVGSSVRMVGGFGKLTEHTSNAFLPDFSIEYGNVDSGEISDLINTGMLKRPRIMRLSGDGANISAPTQFVFNYSRKKTERRMHKIGTYAAALPTTGPLPKPTISNFMFEHGTTPAFNPQVRFVIADLGSSGESVAWDCFVTIDYTVRLMNRVVSQESSV